MKKGLMIIILIIGGLFMTTGCASWNSNVKDWQSEFGNGLNRVVKVYSMDGKLLETYEGRIDIEYDDSRVIFQINGGNRIAIYTKTATVVVEEK